MAHSDDTIRGDILRKALDYFDYLGIAMKEVMIEDFEKQGMIFDNKHYYKIEEIEKRLVETFGEDITPLLIDGIKRKIIDGN